MKGHRRHLFVAFELQPGSEIIGHSRWLGMSMSAYIIVKTNQSSSPTAFRTRDFPSQPLQFRFPLTRRCAVRACTCSAIRAIRMLLSRVPVDGHSASERSVKEVICVVFDSVDVVVVVLKKVGMLHGIPTFHLTRTFRVIHRVT